MCVCRPVCLFVFSVWLLEKGLFKNKKKRISLLISLGFAKLDCQKSCERVAPPSGSGSLMKYGSSLQVGGASTVHEWTHFSDRGPKRSVGTVQQMDWLWSNFHNVKIAIRLHLFPLNRLKSPCAFFSFLKRFSLPQCHVICASVIYFHIWTNMATFSTYRCCLTLKYFQISRRVAISGSVAGKIPKLLRRRRFFNLFTC